jgi:hypothetical protein
VPPLSHMKILVTRNTIASGQALDAGAVYDVSDDDAAILVRLGKATTELPPEPKPTRKAKAES